MTLEFYKNLKRNQKYWIIEITTPSKNQEDDIIVRFTTDKNTVDGFLKDADLNKNFNVRVFENIMDSFYFIDELKNLSKMNLIGWCSKAF